MVSATPVKSVAGWLLALTMLSALPAQTIPVWSNPKLKGQAEKGDRAAKEVLRLIATAKASRVSYLSGFAFTVQSMKVLPPSLGIHVSKEALEEARAAEARGTTWAAADPQAALRPMGKYSAMVRGKDFVEKLEVEARGDFNGDGIEDIAVRCGDALLEGTYRAVRVLVLTRKSAGERLSTLQQWP